MTIGDVSSRASASESHKELLSVEPAMGRSGDRVISRECKNGKLLYVPKMLKVDPEVASKIQARARERGVSVDVYLRELIDQKETECEARSTKINAVIVRCVSCILMIA